MTNKVRPVMAALFGSLLAWVVIRFGLHLDVAMWHAVVYGAIVGAILVAVSALEQRISRSRLE